MRLRQRILPALIMKCLIPIWGNVFFVIIHGAHLIILGTPMKIVAIACPTHVRLERPILTRQILVFVFGSSRVVTMNIGITTAIVVG